MPVNYKELQEFSEKMQKHLTGNDMDIFLEACAKELAARLLRKAIKRTPVGVYPEGSGKKGGTLRRGWTGEEKQNASAFVDSLSVTKSGNKYTIEIVNPVEYASYVEFGHRTRNHHGWVEGRFMLTISEQELQTQAPKILERKLRKYLEGCFK